MGQAQLLLIVLGVVLVGIAIIAGIQAYDQNNRKSSVDALTHDAIRMASDLQTWAQKPEQFGGPTTYGAAGFAEATLDRLGYNENADGVFENSNGTCDLTTVAANNVVIECQNTDLGTWVQVTVTGIADTDIAQTGRALEGGAPAD